VTVCELGTDETETYLIVGSAEADPGHGRISNVSPMGLALMQRGVGEEIMVNTPGGQLRFEIVSIGDGRGQAQ
jgi:transcription elongation factor GreA